MTDMTSPQGVPQDLSPQELNEQGHRALGTNPQDVQYTEQESDLVRRAMLGAIAYVSTSDPGFFDSFRETFAGSRAVAEAPEPIREMFKGGFIMPPSGSSKGEVQGKMLEQVGEATRVLEARSPEQAAAFREIILSATERVAQAAGGVSDAEQQAIAQVRAALGEPGEVTNPDLQPAPEPMSPTKADAAEAPQL